MIHKAKELALKGDRVLFIVAVEQRRDMPTLLKYHLSRHLASHTNIEVQQIAMEDLTGSFLRENCGTRYKKKIAGCHGALRLCVIY